MRRKSALRLELEPFELVAVDHERQVADGVVEAHSAANATATSAASRALATISFRFTSRVRPPLRSWSVASTNGVTACPEMPSLTRLGERLLDQPLDVEALRRGIREQDAGAAELPVRGRDPRRLARVLHLARHVRPAVRRVEERERVGAEAEDRHAEGLQELHRGRHVEQRLRSGRDGEHLRAGEHGDVRGDVGRSREAAVDAADPARAEEPDADLPRDRERPSDGRRPDRALSCAGGEIPRPDLPRVRREAGELGGLETDSDPAVENADGRRDGAGRPDRVLALGRDLEPVRRGEAVRDERRLECDDGSATGESLADLVGHDDQLAHGSDPSRETQRAAASSARSGPPTRNPAASASPAPVVSTTSSTGRAARSTPSNEQPSPPRFSTQDRAGDLADDARLVLVGEHDVRRERRRRPCGTGPLLRREPRSRRRDPR